MSDYLTKHPVYTDFEEACRQSKWAKAVGEIEIVHENKKIKVEIIKAYYGDGQIVYYHTAVPIRKATSQEIDSCKKWRPYN